MEPLQTQVSRRWLPGLALLALAATGCVETKSFLNPGGGDCPPKAAVYEIAATWQNDVGQTHDTTQNGAPVPVIGGRLYLFGGPDQKGHPVDGDGTVVVEMYDQTPGNPPTGLVRMELDQATLKMLQRKDVIGWGYTLLMPWEGYRPDVTQVMLKVRYDPVKGATKYTENVVTLNGLVSFTSGSSTSAAPEAVKKAGPPPQNVQQALALQQQRMAAQQLAPPPVTAAPPPPPPVTVKPTISLQPMPPDPPAPGR